MKKVARLVAFLAIAAPPTALVIPSSTSLIGDVAAGIAALAIPGCSEGEYVLDAADAENILSAVKKELPAQAVKILDAFRARDTAAIEAALNDHNLTSIRVSMIGEGNPLRLHGYVLGFGGNEYVIMYVITNRGLQQVAFNGVEFGEVDDVDILGVNGSQTLRIDTFSHLRLNNWLAYGEILTYARGTHMITRMVVAYPQTAHKHFGIAPGTKAVHTYFAPDVAAIGGNVPVPDDMPEMPEVNSKWLIVPPGDTDKVSPQLDALFTYLLTALKHE